jgi:methyltransferase (TIGR00027 family)
MSELDAIHRRFLDYVALRTKFFDDYLLAACAVGCRQVVVLAAGLDTRAFRLSWPQGTRLFELDLPEIFTFKEQVLKREGAEPVCQRIVVEADLREEWSAPLLQAGFRPTDLSAWLAEGILIYLTEEENDQLLSKISELSPSGSQLALEHMKREAQELEPFRVAADALAELGVSWKSVLANPEEWLAHYGWNGQVYDSADLAAMYDRPLSSYGGLAETETAIEWLVRTVREAS